MGREAKEAGAGDEEGREVSSWQKRGWAGGFHSYLRPIEWKAMCYLKALPKNDIRCSSAYPHVCHAHQTTQVSASPPKTIFRGSSLGMLVTGKVACCSDHKTVLVWFVLLEQREHCDEGGTGCVATVTKLRTVSTRSNHHRQQHHKPPSCYALTSQPRHAKLAGTRAATTLERRRTDPCPKFSPAAGSGCDRGGGAGSV